MTYSVDSHVKNQIILALIVGVIPNFFSALLHLLPPYLVSIADRNKVDEADTSSSSSSNDIIFEILKFVLGKIKRNESWIEHLSITNYLTEQVNVKIRSWWFEFCQDNNNICVLNKCFEWAKKEVTKQERRRFKDSIYRVIDASKKFHHLLDWYQWKGTLKMLGSPKMAALYPLWNGVENRKTSHPNSNKNRFYENPNYYSP